MSTNAQARTPALLHRTMQTYRCLGNAGRWVQPSGARKPSRGDADSSSDQATIEGTLDDPSHRRPKELFRERDCLGTNNAER
ncbi:hypothetical protein AAFF_G00083850 [Aldrovandia affinis]|uniref:Uncharacterized protein n=1 Tax=Aldrovandia affinis TaxID=143900 RepID=A0AAD7RWZ0_9TELE|nr:hypothetical protein AAFF_G00083850 [Aldrovandia affinis]